MTFRKLSTNKEIALELAQRGATVLPVRPHDSTPYTRGGFSAASRSLALITMWWDRWPSACVAIVEVDK